MKKIAILTLLAQGLISCNRSADEAALTAELNHVMDGWHASAARADSVYFFNLMADNAIYLGTAPEERWTKKEFESFAMPYFRRGKAWDFTPNWRNWYFSEDYKTAWFEESLNTWMQECRGSGVMMEEAGKWKLRHYNLSVVIENEKIQEFIQLRQSPLEFPD